MSYESKFEKGQSRKPVFVSHCATAQDKNLSLAARGLLFYYLSMPDGWENNSKKVKADNGIGRDVFWKLNKELIDQGYLIQWQEKSNRGKWGAYHYTAFYDKEDAFIFKKSLDTKLIYQQRKISEKNNPTDGFQPFTEKPHNGESVTIESTKVDKQRKNQSSIDKQKISPREDVDKSDDLPTTPLEKDHFLSHEQLKIPIPPSESAWKSAKEDHWKESDCINKLYDAYPNEWPLIDDFTALHHWMDVYEIHLNMQRSKLRRVISRPIEYIEKALLNRRINHLRKKGDLK